MTGPASSSSAYGSVKPRRQPAWRPLKPPSTASSSAKQRCASDATAWRASCLSAAGITPLGVILNNVDVPRARYYYGGKYYYYHDYYYYKGNDGAGAKVRRRRRRRRRPDPTGSRGESEEAACHTDAAPGEGTP